jgi:hypothetical protein
MFTVIIPAITSGVLGSCNASLLKQRIIALNGNPDSAPKYPVPSSAAFHVV